MKKMTIFAAALLLAVCCKPVSGTDDPEPAPKTDPVFAKGADLSWVTEMEGKGYKFYNDSGAVKECTALLKSIGFNTVRLRVWVNPDGGWCSAQDVLVKARRARDLGMQIMIDFHYSDSWADPGKQNVPASWQGHGVQQMSGDVYDHTKEVLNLLKADGIDVLWVQVGNEVTNGMLWENGRVKGSEVSGFATLFNSGYSAVKQVYPDAAVVLHVDNAWNLGTLEWFYDLAVSGGCHFDMIGLSLYPSYWENGSYPDWKPKCTQALSNFKTLHERYSLPVMLVEFGMPAAQPSESAAALQYLLDGTSSFRDWFKGIILWEPESEPARNGYAYGAFSGGKPTSALAPFKN